jgi:NAD(P)-dependent dehydrogenase (short-subunit alcohol dehydrogenase family)
VGEVKDSLVGKNVILTGASRGLGRELAKAFWNHGANLLLVARTHSALQQLQKELVTSGLQNADIFVCDLMQPSAPDRIFSKARNIWDHVDVLINNAAIIGPIGKSWEIDRSEWRPVIEVNLMVPVELSMLCVSWMKEKGSGKIVQLSGGGATRPRPNFSAYSTAKTGLIRFSETLAEEVRPFNIQINCIAPGTLNTQMQESIRSAGPERAGFEEHADALQYLSKEDVGIRRAVDLCLFLASSDSDKITGKLISAVWDPWERLSGYIEDLLSSDIYTLRRIVPSDRGKDWK